MVTNSKKKKNLGLVGARFDEEESEGGGQGEGPEDVEGQLPELDARQGGPEETAHPGACTLKYY